MYTCLVEEVINYQDSRKTKIFLGTEISGTQQRKIINELVVLCLGRSPLDLLPTDLLYLIMEHLDDLSLLSLGRTSKYMQKEVVKHRNLLDVNCWFNPDWKPPVLK